MLFGFFVFLNNRMLSSFSLPDIYWVRLLCMVVSVIVVALGVFLYLRARLIPHPADGLLLAIQKKTRWKQQNAKICLDFVITVLAAAVSLIFAQGIVGIREGTLIAMLGIGKAMGFFSERFSPKIDALLKL